MKNEMNHFPISKIGNTYKDFVKGLNTTDLKIIGRKIDCTFQCYISLFCELS